MKKIVLFLQLVLFSFSAMNAMAQQSVMRTPGKYMMPMDNASAAFPGSANKEGELWVVFSDRPDNQMYSDKACQKANGQKLDFMQAMYVIAETDKAIQVVEFDAADMRGTLKDGARDRAAWILKDNMLLWRTCLKTRDVNLPEFKDGIFNKKAMVLNIISGNQSEIRVPEYHAHPRCSQRDSINSALVYQINYVYKETPTAYLLADIPEILDVERDKPRVKGWVLKSQTTAWNHRLAFEVNWDEQAVAERKAKGYKASITASKNGGESIFKEGTTWYNKRAIGEVDRFPVLDVTNGSTKVGVIGDLRSQEGASLSSDEFAEIKHTIDSMSGALRNVNVIFVVDGTSSMIPYSGSIQNAIKQTMRELLKSQNNYRFGALLYRDASEGNANAIHYTRDLSSNYNGVNSMLSRYLNPTFNRCNSDPEEAMYYGLKKAIERFDPPVGESNFVILIGDAGNHQRTQFTDCNGQTANDFTRVEEKELVDLMVRKNINLYAYQVHHKVEQDVQPAYDAFRTQVESLMTQTVRKRVPGMASATVSDLLTQSDKEVEILPSLGVPGYFKKAPQGGTVHTSVLMRDVADALKDIDARVNHQLEGISEYLNGKIKGDNARELAGFIRKLEDQNIPSEKLDVVFQKNGQVYNVGYAERFRDGMKNPVYQDVLLMSREDLYSIKRSLERLIPTDELSLPPNESRSFIVYGWGEILVDILGYFPEVNESIDTLSLYTLSAILTGWGGKEKYKDIKLLDVTSPERFPDVMLYEYLIDWCITKGHIQSIYDGQNLLTEDFFRDHQWTIFYEYLYHLTNGAVEEDPEMGARFSEYFERYNKEYNNFKASFRIPMGTGSGLKHYWIDSRIFPHQTKNFGEEDIIKYLYRNYNN
ncbi:type VI secretion system protein TssR domain-containing protein [Roseimarinus sediminis]|uniref:type VI secretion system protein TssR domain-containing protein n=1 Tax=Roseimarinus sediminis TaxID=1610899 RepID=UPI003D1D5BE6